MDSMWLSCKMEMMTFQRGAATDCLDNHTLCWVNFIIPPPVSPLFVWQVTSWSQAPTISVPLTARTQMLCSFPEMPLFLLYLLKFLLLFIIQSPSKVPALPLQPWAVTEFGVHSQLFGTELSPRWLLVLPPHPDCTFHGSVTILWA